ncbi:serine/threonine-protein kinase [Catenulispora subtropica]|uniref:non-specific serine/threonine protein kinase n=1 Tax=Catenulispora subtropica TaxID=450798 RepID=A0ABP5CGK4_9ACTN
MEPLRPADPRRISSYEILNRLGAGGMGQVYLGRSPSGRRVAVKVIRGELTSDPTFRERFRREVTAMRQVSGFFTAPVVDADPDGDPAWLATAYVPGPSLSDAVKQRGPMPQQDALVLGAGLAEALIAIHREGLTHRDLKPANVLLADDGPRVIDFGLAVTAQSSTVTQAGTVVGTPSFMSPEQVSGQPVGPSSDVWSLGAVLLWAATGRQPFGEGGTMEMMFRVVNGEPDLSGLSGTLLQLVSACMTKEPGARPTPERILEVLSEGAGVEATAAMGWIPPQAAPTMPGTPTSQPQVVSQPTPPHSMPSVPSMPSMPMTGPGQSGAAPQFEQSLPLPQGPHTPPHSMPSVPSVPSVPSMQVPPQQMGGPLSGPPSNPSNPSLPTYQGAPPTQAAPVANPWASPPSPPYGVQQGTFAPPPKKNRNGLIAAVGGVVTVALVGGGIALFASGGGSGGSSGGTSGGTLGGTGGIDQSAIPADFPLSSLLTDDDASQYLKTSATAGTPVDNTSDDPATYDKAWSTSTGAELRIQASNYKKDATQAVGAFLGNTSTLATEAKFEDQGKLGNSDKTEIQVDTDASSGLQHCRIEMIRGGLDITVRFTEEGSAAGAHTDVVNLAKLVAGRLPKR